MLFVRSLVYILFTLLLANRATTQTCGDGIINGTSFVYCTIKGQWKLSDTLLVALVEQCDPPSPCCSSSCRFLPATTECRASQGDCDVPEFCTGSSSECPADLFRPQGFVCRDELGDCDITEICSGDSPLCPADRLVESGISCRAAVGDCDVPDTCDGISPLCIDLVKPQGTPCGQSSVAVCDVEDVCDGVSGTCPDLFHNNTVLCRRKDPSLPCDTDDFCSGLSAECTDQKDIECETALQQEESEDLIGVIVGVPIAVVALAAVSAMTVCFCWKKRTQLNSEKEDEPTTTDPVRDENYDLLPASATKNQNSSGSESPESKTVSGSRALPSTMPSTYLTIQYDELQIMNEIGSGAQGTVFKGRYRDQWVAIKVLNQSLERQDPKAISDFEYECKLMISLPQHPNVIKCFGMCNDTKKLVCIVTEFCSNGSLQSYLRSHTLDPSRQLFLFKGIASGLRHLHDNKLVHRDLAARNILLSEKLEAKISDLGMSRILVEDSQQTQNEIGPLKWMAPECLMDQKYSVKSDAWAFGVTMIEILTHSEPFPNMAAGAVAVKISNGELYPSPPENAGVLADIMKQCWNPDPSDRPTFTEICNVFDKVVVKGGQLAWK